jgi:hypothetical protein
MKRVAGQPIAVIAPVADAVCAPLIVACEGNGVSRWFLWERMMTW